MSRSVSWRRVCPDQVIRRIEQALEARCYILRETGPTGFLVKEDGNEKKYKVSLGDPNSCTCSIFMKEKELCIHILWILLRKFRIRKENQLIFQKGLVEREINEIIQGIHVWQREGIKTEEIILDDKNELAAKSIDQEDVCPICQEELWNQKEPLTHCKYGCGNNIHVKCMKIWAQHRKSDGDNVIKCPLCRTDFGSYQDIMKEFHRLASRQRKQIETNDVHIGATCHHCHVSPIQGKCFRCVVCLDLHLCQECFGKQVHTQHSFQFRKNTNQRWRVASRSSNKILPTGIVEDLQRRDLAGDDYELLLQLDSRNSSESGESITLPLSTLSSNSRELKESLQCQMCCEPFRISNHVRRLACRHTFHKDCIDGWIADGHKLCPFDRSRIAGRKDVRPRSKNSVEKLKASSDEGIELSVFGISSSNVALNRQSRETTISRPDRRRSRNSSASSVDDVAGDINNLVILGECRRDYNNESGLQPPTASMQKKCVAHREDVSLSPSSNAALPPTYPIRKEARNHSRSRNARKISNGCLNGNNRAQGCAELTIGSPVKVSSAGSNRKRGTLVKKKLSSGAVAPFSSSEPDLLTLTDLFRISRIASLEGGTSQ